MASNQNQDVMLNCCEAVEKELDAVTTQFGILSQDSIKLVEDKINQLQLLRTRWGKFFIIYKIHTILIQ